MNTLATLFCDLVTASDLIADAIVKRTCPVEDEISTSEAYALYGRRWVEERLRQGSFTGRESATGSSSRATSSSA